MIKSEATKSSHTAGRIMVSQGPALDTDPAAFTTEETNIQQSRQRPLADFTGFHSTGTCSQPPQPGMCTPPVPAPAAACPSPYPLNLETLLRTPIAPAAFADLSRLLMQCSPRTTHDAVAPNSPSQ